MGTVAVLLLQPLALHSLWWSLSEPESVREERFPPGSDEKESGTQDFRLRWPGDVAMSVTVNTELMVLVRLGMGLPVKGS